MQIGALEHRQERPSATVDLRQGRDLAEDAADVARIVHQAQEQVEVLRARAVPCSEHSSVEVVALAQ